MILKTLDPKNKNQLASYINTFLILTGLYGKKISKNHLKNSLYYCYTIIEKAAYSYFYFSMLIELIRDIIRGVALELLIPSVGVLITMTKVYIQIIVYSKNNVIKMYDHVSKIERDVWEQDDDEMKKIYVRKISSGKFLRTLVTVLAISTILMFLIADAIAMVKLKAHIKETNSTTPTIFLYNYYFPADRLDHLSIVLPINCLFAYLGIIYYTVTQLITILLCVATSTHLSLIQHRLKTYISEDFTEDKMEATIAELKNIIRDHQITIKFHEKINGGTKSIIMLNYILSSVDVAAGAMQMIAMDQCAKDQWVYFYTVAVTLSIFCLSWSTNEVFVESLAVGNAAYASRWHLLNKEGRQLTHIVLLRSLKPLTMTIGPFGPMTLDSFIVIIKMAYSIVTFMKKY